MQFPLQVLSIFILLLVPSSSRTSVDDLKMQIKKSSNTNKAELCLKLSDQYYYLNENDSAIYYAEKALIISKSNKNDKVILQSYIELFYNYRLLSDRKKEKYYLDSAKKYAYRIQDTTSICDVHLNLATFYSEGSKYDSAIIHYNKSQKLSYIINYKTNTVSTLIGLGEIDYERGNIQNALSNYLEAFKYSEAITDRDLKLSLLIDMGNIYGDDNQIEKAKKYYNQAKELAKEINESEVLSVIYNNLATLYQVEKKYQKALNYFNQSLKIEQNLGCKSGVALALNNIGENYLRMKNYNQAIVYLRESLETHRKLKLENEIIFNLEALARIHLNTGNYKQAFDYLKEGLHLSKKLKTKGKKSDLLMLLAEYYNKVGNNKMAYSSMLDYNNLKDSMQNEARSARIAQLQARFDTDKKEKENEILRVKNQYTQAKLDKERIRTNYLFIFSFLAFVFIVLIFILFRSKVKINNHIKVINEKLEESNSKLKITNATKDKFFSIIAHDLKSPFNAILGFSELIKSEMKSDKNIETIGRYNTNINESAHNLFTLLENLLLWANDQNKNLKLKATPINLNELIQSNLNIFKLKASDKSINLYSDLQPNTIAFGDINMIDTVIRNLINNALKFTEKNGDICLSAKLKGDSFHISVKDTGIGISKTNQDKLFRLDSNFTTTGTNYETGSGLGLILCKEFVKKNGGEIWVESELDKGSNFIFTLKSN